MHNNRFFRENPKVLEVRIGSNQSRIGGEMIDALEVKQRYYVKETWFMRQSLVS